MNWADIGRESHFYLGLANASAAGTSRHGRARRMLLSPAD
jgi:hypothetical protein